MEKVLIITGIGDDTDYLKKATQDWQEDHNLQPIIYKFGWHGRREFFKERLNGLKEAIQENEAKLVVGISAGASAIVNVSEDFPDIKMVNVCGRLSLNGYTLYPFFLYKLRTPIFDESIRQCQQHLPKLNPIQLLTFSPRFDELVPDQATRLEGSQHIKTEAIGHRSGILKALEILPEYI